MLWNRLNTDGSSSTADPLVEEKEIGGEEIGGDVTPPYRPAIVSKEPHPLYFVAPGENSDMVRFLPS